MLRRLKVKNYRPFADELEILIKPFTLIFGYNNAGKSTLLRMKNIIAYPFASNERLLDLGWSPHSLEYYERAMFEWEIDVWKSTAGDNNFPFNFTNENVWPQVIFRREIKLIDNSKPSPIHTIDDDIKISKEEYIDHLIISIAADGFELEICTIFMKDELTNVRNSYSIHFNKDLDKFLNDASNSRSLSYKVTETKLILDTGNIDTTNTIEIPEKYSSIINTINGSIDRYLNETQFIGPHRLPAKKYYQKNELDDVPGFKEIFRELDLTPIHHYQNSCEIDTWSLNESLFNEEQLIDFDGEDGLHLMLHKQFSDDQLFAPNTIYYDYEILLAYDKKDLYNKELYELRLLLSGISRKLPFDLVFIIQRSFISKEYTIKIGIGNKTEDFTELRNIDEVGFGISQILPIIFKLVYRNDSLLIIEQPEAQINPRMQKEFIQTLVDIYQSEYFRMPNLLLETHSQIMLEYLRKKIENGELNQDDIGFYLIKRHSDYSDIRPVKVYADGDMDTIDLFNELDEIEGYL